MCGWMERAPNFFFPASLSQRALPRFESGLLKKKVKLGDSEKQTPPPLPARFSIFEWENREDRQGFESEAASGGTGGDQSMTVISILSEALPSLFGDRSSPDSSCI